MRVFDKQTKPVVTIPEYILVMAEKRREVHRRFDCALVFSKLPSPNRPVKSTAKQWRTQFID